MLSVGWLTEEEQSEEWWERVFLGGDDRGGCRGKVKAKKKTLGATEAYVMDG